MTTAPSPAPGSAANSAVYAATLEQVHRGLHAAHAQMDQVMIQLDRLHADMRAMSEAVMSHTEAVNTAVLRAEAIALRTEAKNDARTLRMNLLAELHALRNELKAEFVTSNLQVAKRFGTVDMRFDTVEETLSRVERDIGGMRVDVMRIEDSLLDKQQAAVQNGLRSAFDSLDQPRLATRKSS